jgi:hypothetical protein
MLRRSLRRGRIPEAGWFVGCWGLDMSRVWIAEKLKIQQRVRERERETDAVQSTIELEPPAKRKLHNLKIFAIL